MKRIFFIISLIVFVMGMLFGEQIVVSVSDFKVESDNPSYKYIGKGLSMLVAGELRKSPNIKILERKYIMKILEEQELSVSYLTDDSQQVKIGELLSAQYIIFGEIIDMGSTLLLSVRMVDVSTGEVVWQEEVTEKIETYDYIGAYFAKSILDELNLTVENTIVKKIEKKEEKKEDAIVKLSEGIDAYDKGDEKKAKEVLEEAKKIDPENEVTRYYLSKLSVLSPKFRIETELYAATYNPASLGFLERDSLYYWMGSTFNPPWVETDHGGAQFVNDHWVMDSLSTHRGGYLFPVGNSLGIGLEFLSGHFDLKAFPEPSYPIDFNGTTIDNLQAYFYNLGGSVSIGYKIMDIFSVGSSFLLWNTQEGEGQSVIAAEGIYLGIDAGFLFRTTDNKITFDLHGVYTNQKVYYVDQSSREVKTGYMPVIAEGSFTYTIIQNMLFFGLKAVGDIYFDEREGHALRVIPVIEYWMFPFVSARIGYEYAHLNQNEEFSIGNGFLGGITIKVWEFEGNVNFTYRNKPARLLPGAIVENFTLLIGVTYSPGLLKR